MAAVPFETTGGEATDIQDLVKGIVTTNIQGKATPTTWRTQCPQIQLQERDATTGEITGGGNISYYYIANPTLNTGSTWTGPAWVAANRQHLGEKAAAVKIAPGTAYWYKDPGADSDITFAGQVVSMTDKEIHVPAGKWQMVCNPYPMAITLNTDTVQFIGLTDDIQGRATPTTWRTQCPQIQLQERDAITGEITGGGNISYYYIANPTLNTGSTWTGAGWVAANRQHLGEKAAAVTIPAGSGFWFKDPSKDVTIKFVR